MRFFIAIIIRIFLVISILIGGVCIFALWLGDMQPPSPRIVYMANIIPNSENWDLFMLDLQTGAIIRLTKTPRINERYPAWSSDGTQIAYHANANGNRAYNIFIVPITDVTQTTTPFVPEGNMGDLATAYDKAMPAWSFDDQFIGFHAKTQNGRYGLFMGNADGSEMRMLISPLEGLDMIHFAWSPNGKDIAFTEATNGGSKIYLFTVPETIQNATSNRANMRLFAENASFPAWSPDGTKLAYIKEGDRGSRIFIYDFATQTEAQLPLEDNNRIFEDTHPEWSTDGQSIIFASDRQGINFDLYLIQINGEGLRRLTWSDGDELAPDWVVYAGG